MSFKLPALNYAFDALEPFIDARTMEIHHDKHHQTYVDNLNATLDKAAEWAAKGLDEIIADVNSAPEAVRTALRNHGGGVWNHSLFWTLMKKAGGGDPADEIGEAIRKTFGSFEELKKQFNDAGLKRFGSGWAWLAVNKSGRLQVLSTANQDNPLTDGLYPVLLNDVWEHAYYLKYQNRRAEYLTQWWNTVDWDAVNQRYKQAR